ncbi:MAG: Na(+)/H(+) antiporter subunit D [Alphaproteobacteria bacterium]|nr:Na(+)/H(+) antiporter subunit D [Alphaproteobacteria bacterium]
MSSLLFHPALPILIGAFLILKLSGTARSIVLLGAPLVSFAFIWMTADGVILAIPYMEWTLEPFKADKLSRLFATVFAIMAFAGNLYALKQEKVLELFAANVYIAFSLGVVFAGDLITVFVFWEMMALASSTVIFSAGTATARAAGMRYMMVHLLGGVVLMAGIAGEVSATGSIAFTSMLPDTLPRALILAGFLLNTGAPPFSAWVPDSYPEASYSGMVFLSAFTTKTAVYVLARGFPGAEILIFIGLSMIFYGIIYGLCENNARKMLGYSIVNQVGFMVTAIGIGSALAINGAVAHAFAHIIYKALLIMATGSVFYVTGKRKFTEYGGLFRTMPLTAICCIIGGLSISAFPFTSGFVAKAMTSEAAYVGQYYWVWYLLAAGTAGVFLDVGIKLQYFVFFGKDSGLRPPEPPLHMRTATVFFAVLCVGIGLVPQQFYQLLPYSLDYEPNTPDHIVTQFQILLFSGAAFFLFLKYYGWHLVESLTLDLDWLYRVWGRKLAVTFTENSGSARDSIIDDLSKGASATIDGIHHRHGPDGILARTMPTGRMVFWAIVMLAIYLLVDFAFM